jgi:hypothetical protein
MNKRMLNDSFLEFCQNIFYQILYIKDLRTFYNTLYFGDIIL